MKPGLKFKNPASAFMLFLILFWLAIQVIIVGAVMVAQELGSPVNWLENLWFMIMMQLVGFLLPMFLWLLITGDSFRRNMPNRPLGATNIVLLIILSFLILPFVMLISAISSQFVTNDVAVMLEGLAGQPWWLMMLAIAVTPGIVEELVFRGYIQSNTRGSITKVAVLNGFLFALLHLNPHQFVYTFVLGVVFAFLVYHTKSIWAGIIPHFLVNGVNVTISHIAMRGLENGEYPEPTVAQILYDSFAPTNPQLAQRLYEWAYGISADAFAIGAIGFLAIFTTAGFAGVYIAFVSHNRKWRMQFEAPPEETPAIEETPIEETPIEEPPQKRFKVDWCLAAVVVIYLLVVIPTLLFLS